VTTHNESFGFVDITPKHGQGDNPIDLLWILTRSARTLFLTEPTNEHRLDKTGEEGGGFGLRARRGQLKRIGGRCFRKLEAGLTYPGANV
jgi:hypothetical protein